MAPPDASTSVEVPAMWRVLIVGDVDHPDLPAVRWGSRTARALGVESVMVARDEFASAERPPERAEIEASATSQDAAEMADRFGYPVDDVAVVMDDDPDAVDDAIVTMANEHDVVVVGTGDVVGFTGFSLGAEAHSLAHKLDCPLVAVPASTEPSDGPIVVGLSGDDADLRPLAWATSLGRALARSVVAVHAVNPMYDTFDNAGNLGHDEAHAKQLAAASGVEFVERFDTPEQLCREAVTDLGASLLVVAAKHHRSLGGRMLGRVADGLLHEPPCPLAIVTHDYVEG